jgi:hypothetical protein
MERLVKDFSKDLVRKVTGWLQSHNAGDYSTKVVIKKGPAGAGPLNLS